MLHDPARPARRRDAHDPAAARSWRARAWPLARKIAAEPVAHFLVLGALLFLAATAWQAHQRTYRIEVTPAHIAELSRKYALQFGYAPDAATLASLVKEDLHDEVLFRQGLADGLAKDDEIVRRRVIQKEGFLIQNLAAPAEPTAEQLQAFYAAHRGRYAAPQRATFSHIYFSDDRGGAVAAKARAQAALKTLKPSITRAPERGDPFPDLYDFSAYEPEQVARLFGHTEFAKAAFQAPIGRWSGPYRSAFGWHLIYVDARTAAGEAPLASVRDRVREDYLQDAQDKANAAAFDRVAQRFTIVRKDVK